LTGPARSLDLGGVKLRNRVVASASLVGYGAPPANRLIPYGLSPVARFLPLERFGAVTTRTLTLEPRDGHFTTRTDWRVRDWPRLARMYSGALRRIDAGWMNAFGWCNIGLDAYLRDYFPRTGGQNRIVSLGGFSGEDFRRLLDRVGDAIEPGAIAAVELNVSCHNVNFPFEQILEDVLDVAAERSTHPVIVKLSPDDDYVAAARLAEERGIAALTAINTVKGLRLDPRTGEPFMTNRYGGMSGRAIKPICLRVISELREAGIRLPVIATGGIRDFDDAREYFWAGADAVSLGSETFLASPAGYLLSPLRARRITRLVHRVERHEPRLVESQARLTNKEALLYASRH
jgi:dihydroorotate dehydrogenase (NAD+) catalytic subunit